MGEGSVEDTASAKTLGLILSTAGKKNQNQREENINKTYQINKTKGWLFIFNNINTDPTDIKGYRHILGSLNHRQYVPNYSKGGPVLQEGGSEQPSNKVT